MLGVYNPTFGNRWSGTLKVVYFSEYLAGAGGGWVGLFQVSTILLLVTAGQVLCHVPMCNPCLDLASTVDT